MELQNGAGSVLIAIGQRQTKHGQILRIHNREVDLLLLKQELDRFTLPSKDGTKVEIKYQLLSLFDCQIFGGDAKFTDAVLFGLRQWSNRHQHQP